MCLGEFPLVEAEEAREPREPSCPAEHAPVQKASEEREGPTPMTRGAKRRRMQRLRKKIGRQERERARASTSSPEDELSIVVIDDDVLESIALPISLAMDLPKGETRTEIIPVCAIQKDERLEEDDSLFAMDAFVALPWTLKAADKRIAEPATVETMDALVRLPCMNRERDVLSGLSQPIELDMDVTLSWDAEHVVSTVIMAEDAVVKNSTVIAAEDAIVKVIVAEEVSTAPTTPGSSSGSSERVNLLTVCPPCDQVPVARTFIHFTDRQEGWKRRSLSV